VNLNFLTFANSGRLFILTNYTQHIAWNLCTQNIPLLADVETCYPGLGSGVC